VGGRAVVSRADVEQNLAVAMPAVLVEGGFISNPKERALLRNPLYLEKIARGIVEGIDRYFQN